MRTRVRALPNTSLAPGTAGASGGPFRRPLLRLRAAEPRRPPAEVRAGWRPHVGRFLRGTGEVSVVGGDGARRHRLADAGRGGGLGGLARWASRGDGASSSVPAAAVEARGEGPDRGSGRE